MNTKSPAQPMAEPKPLLAHPNTTKLRKEFIHHPAGPDRLQGHKGKPKVRKYFNSLVLLVPPCCARRLVTPKRFGEGGSVALPRRLGAPCVLCG